MDQPTGGPHVPTTQNVHHAHPNQERSWLGTWGNKAATWGTRAATIPLILLFVLSGMVSYRSVQAVHDQDQLVDHSRLVLVTIGLVYSDLYGAQAEAYNYVITGNTIQLQAFLHLRPQVNSNLVTLSQLLRGSPAQEGRVQKLRALVPQEFDALQHAVNLRQAGAKQAALHYVAGGADDKVSATNQALIEALGNTERGGLRLQIARASTIIEATTLTILVVVLVDLALLAVIFFLVRQTIRLREQLAQEQARAKAQTEMEVLQETNRQMDDLIGIASHEFRTPLTTVKANLQLARRRMLRTRDEFAVLPLLDRAAVSTGRLERLADDLLDMSRIKADTLVMRRVSFELGGLVRDCVSEQQEHHPARALSLSLPGVPAPLFADPDRIRQVITNYLGNAFKFSTEEKPVSVALAMAGEQARVGVRDEGPGIPASEHQRIWERYHRASDVERKTGSDVGLGLGLYISKTIISQHGGQVGVLSEVGHGAEFFFTLPLAVPTESSNQSETGGQPESSDRPLYQGQYHHHPIRGHLPE
jgi:signal transduction histidine kinase